MATITAQATANLTAAGNSTGSGTITWTAPAFPSGVTRWDSIVITGTWSWNGKGNVSSVTINGTNTSAAIAFSVSLGTSATSPLSITCTGNKNATGNSFTWTSLIVTYTYTPPKVYYNVSVGAISNGTVTLSQTGNVEEGTVITITAIPSSGYEIDRYYVNGSLIGGNSFTVTQNSIVTVTFKELPKQQLNIKVGTSWQAAKQVYKIVGGVWQLQTNLSSIYDSSVKYIKKN